MFDRNEKSEEREKKINETLNSQLEQSESATKSMQQTKAACLNVKQS